MFKLGYVCDKLQPSALITISKPKKQRLSEDSGDATRPGRQKESEAYCANLILDANDIVTICWTSGTTIQPEGVPRSHTHWRTAGMSSPDELDALLSAHPDIEAVVVVGYDDEIIGEKVGVVMVAKPEVDSISLDTITAYLANQGIAKFKFPEQLRMVDSLPMIAVGKVLRRELKPLFQA